MTTQRRLEALHPVRVRVPTRQPRLPATPHSLPGGRERVTAETAAESITPTRLSSSCNLGFANEATHVNVRARTARGHTRRPAGSRSPDREACFLLRPRTAGSHVGAPGPPRFKFFLGILDGAQSSSYNGDLTSGVQACGPFSAAVIATA